MRFSMILSITALVLPAGAGVARAQQVPAHPTNVGFEEGVYSVPYGEPYSLDGRRLVFTSWLFVRQGGLSWVSRTTGENVTANRDMQIGDWGADYVRHSFPSGVRLEVEPAERRGPVIARDRPWEAMGAEITTLIGEAGRYRAWGTCQAAGGVAYHCYYESTDGESWERPRLGQVEFQGSRDNNLIDFPHGTVFVDPSAPAAERYKWVQLGTIDRTRFEEFRSRRPDDWHPLADRDSHIYAVRGAVSPDGLHWTWLPEPLCVEHSDTQVTAYYDMRRREYVIFTRNYITGRKWPQAAPEMGRYWWEILRRSIGRTASPTFGHFPASELVLAPSPDMRPSELLYTNGYTSIPGAPDHHVMFPSIWDVASDQTDIRVAVSFDGRLWQMAGGGQPVLRTGVFGEFDGGCVFGRVNLAELPNGDFVLPYTGYRYPHKYPRGAWAFDAGYAVWPKGRIFALVADESGRFSTVGLVPPGNRLRINAVTTRAGRILVEVCDLGGNPVPGRTFADAVPLVGDCHNTPVLWRSGEDLGVPDNHPVLLNVRLEQARIYWLEFGS